MKHILALLLLALALPATAASADCYAGYKAKKDGPLRLHYGVAEIRGACDKAAAGRELEARRAAGGWKLLEVVDVFDASGLEERRSSAGENYLRY